MANGNALGKLVRAHGVLGTLRLAIALVATKVISPKARLIRRPVYIRNRHLIDMGERLTVGVGMRLEAFGEGGGPPLIVFGKDVQLNDYVHIGAVLSVRIDDNVLIASKVFISDHNHGRYSGDGRHDSPEEPPALRPLSSAPVWIQSNVWLGEYVSVLPGVTIGRGSIIGSMSVVTRDIPPHCIAVGSPARVVKRYEPGTGRWEKA